MSMTPSEPLLAFAAIEDGGLAAALADRYAGWDGALGQSIAAGTETLESLTARVENDGLNPRPRSGRQERLENWVNRFT